MLAILGIQLFASGNFVDWFPLRGLTSDNFAELSLLGKIGDYFLHIASGGETKSEALDLGRHEFIPWQIGIVG